MGRENGEYSHEKDLLRKEQELRILRQNSDAIRRSIQNNELTQFSLRNARKAGVPVAQVAYFKIHSMLFNGDAYLIHGADSKILESNLSAESRKGDIRHYQTQIGKLRTIDVSGGGFQNIRSDLLGTLQDGFFSAIDSIDLSVLTEKEKYTYISLVKSFLKLAHFTFEGDGRVNEEFSVWLGQYAGLDFGISTTGYRGFIDDARIQPLQDVQKRVVRSVLSKIAGAIYHTYGISGQKNTVPSSISTADSIDFIRDVLRTNGKSPTLFEIEDLHARLLQKEAMNIIHGIQGFSLATEEERRAVIEPVFQRHEHAFLSMREFYEEKKSEPYLFIEEEFGAEADKVMVKGLLAQREIEEKGPNSERYKKNFWDAIKILKKRAVGESQQIIKKIESIVPSDNHLLLKIKRLWT